MLIEKASSSDISPIAALEQRCFPDPWPADMIQRQLQSFTVARQDNALCGYICLSHVLDEGSIDIIATAPELRRQGIADALLTAAQAEADSLSLAFITLEVRASNAPAIALYEKHNFVRVGLRKGYYQNPKEDAILMTRFT